MLDWISLWRSSIRSLFHSPAASSLSGPNILSRTFFSLRWDQVSHSYFHNTRIRQDMPGVSLHLRPFHDEGFQGRRLHKNRKLANWRLPTFFAFICCILCLSFTLHNQVRLVTGISQLSICLYRCLYKLTAQPRHRLCICQTCIFTSIYFFAKSHTLRYFGYKQRCRP